MLQLLPADTARWIGSRVGAAEPRFRWEAPRCGTTTPWAALPTARMTSGARGASENLELEEVSGAGMLSASSVLSSPGDTSQAAWPCSGQHHAGQIKQADNSPMATAQPSGFTRGSPGLAAAQTPCAGRCTCRLGFLSKSLSMQGVTAAWLYFTHRHTSLLHEACKRRDMLFPSSWFPGVPAPWPSIDISTLAALITSDSSVLGGV